MKKLWALFLFGFCLCSSAVQAQSMVTEQKKNDVLNVVFGAFMDYPPIADYNGANNAEVHFETIFNDALQKLSKPYNWFLITKRYRNNDTIKESFYEGQIDIFLGDYYEDRNLKKVSYIYPAVLNNPIHVITLPHKSATIKTTADLKNLKGVYLATEHFSPYMLNNFKQYNIQKAENVLEAYEKLFIGEIDFIIGSYYYNYVQACLLGLKNDIIFSKEALWNMPLFFAVSKATFQEERIKQALSKIVFEPEFKSLVENSLREKVRAYEIKGQSVVPPSFVRKQTEADVTPADQKEKED